MVHQDFPFQSIREKDFKGEIKEMANSWFCRLFLSLSEPSDKIQQRRCTGLTALELIQICLLIGGSVV